MAWVRSPLEILPVAPTRAPSRRVHLLSPRITMIVHRPPARRATERIHQAWVRCVSYMAAVDRPTTTCPTTGARAADPAPEPTPSAPPGGESKTSLVPAVIRSEEHT